MTMFAQPMLLLVPGLFILVASLALAALVLFQRGRGPLRLAAPRCARCAHPLADTTARCPECGVDPSAVPPIFGRRRSNRKWIAGSMGLAILVLAVGSVLAGGVQSRAGMPWIHRPYQRLDLSALAAVIARDPNDDKAARELLVRVSQASGTGAGTNSDTPLDFSRELARAFTLRGRGIDGVSSELSACLSALRAAGLPDAAWHELLDSIIAPPTFQVRLRHRPGRQIAVRLPCPFWGGTDTGTAMVERARLDDAPLVPTLSGLAQWGRTGVSILEAAPVEDGAVRAASPVAVGSRTLELDWVQTVGPAALAPSTTAIGEPLDTSGASWVRRGTTRLTVELRANARAAELFTPITDAKQSPWPGGLADIGYFEIRELGDRSLVVFEAPPHRDPALGVVGQWTLRHGDRSIPLSQVVAPDNFEFNNSRSWRTSLLVEPAIDVASLDARALLTLEYRPDPGTAERHTAVDALWLGDIDIPVRPGDLVLDETGGVRAWVHRGRSPAEVQP